MLLVAGTEAYEKGGGDVDISLVYCCENMLRSSAGSTCRWLRASGVRSFRR